MMNNNNQKYLALKASSSLEKTNRSVKHISTNSKIERKRKVCVKGRHPQKATILAAGYGLRMVPINTEEPKGLLWDHILYKFNDQNGCTLKDINDFINLPVKNKICFTVQDKYAKAPYIKKIKAPRSHTEIMASYEPFGNSKYVNVNDLINSL